ncbi:recombinase family protein [Streptomyces sp. NPDC020096]
MIPTPTLSAWEGENGTSAFKKKAIRSDGSVDWIVLRPDFRQLLADLASGVIFYALDRLVRQPRDLEDLIDDVASRRAVGWAPPITCATSWSPTVPRPVSRHATTRAEPTEGVGTLRTATQQSIPNSAKCPALASSRACAATADPN